MADPAVRSPDQAISVFIERWKKSAAAERANYQLFLTELCGLLGVPQPEPTRADVALNAYVFERDVTFQNMDGTTSIGRIDLYKRGCFVLEAKQGSEQAADDDPFELASKPKKTKKGTAVRGTKGWDDAMVKARGQAEQYARALPLDEGWPPFLVVVDVGHTIELFADFTKSGKTYLPFPDPASFRIPLDQLADTAEREKLQSVWIDPLSLDPSKRSAKVTRELADRLAKLAKSLEASKYDPGRVSQFLMRCLFTMFAEDVDLIPSASFTELLKTLRGEVQNFPDMVRDLWESMDKGTFSPILRQKLRRFNGGLFEDCEALPLSEPQLELLIEASSAQWREVEPAIFGTLLERALDPIERHKLGAHYTPRAYVERLVMPTIIEPLRDEWDTVRTAALTEATNGNTKDAIETVREFHRKLCETRVLDPACGTGNFLYVALEHMKRLEGEILNTLRDLGYKQIEIITVDPHQFLGIEVNPRAAAIADLVLWIGYLQWHLRTRDLSQIQEPIIHKFHNIECRDAVLAWDSVEPVNDEHGQPVTRWDGRTMKRHPVTDENIPDDAARVPVVKYINPRKAEWAQADYIVGNPPFVGTRRMRLVIGDGYVAALADAHPGVPENADFVMYWWNMAAAAVSHGLARRFGLITTNSITQTFNRALVQSYLFGDEPLSIYFAVPDHPWIESADGASVRVAMTVGVKGKVAGTLLRVAREHANAEDVDVIFEKPSCGIIAEDLRTGASPATAVVLAANGSVAYWGVKFYGDGFIVTPEQASHLKELDDGKSLARPFVSGRDLTATPRNMLAIDCNGLSVDDVARDFPHTYQWLLDRVKPVRDHNPRALKRTRWWIFGENQPGMRRAVDGLPRFIGTTETAKHRVFQFFGRETLAEGTVTVIASSDALHFGVLSSRVHVVWALAAGGRLGVGNDPRYNKTRCFDPFVFPNAPDAVQESIRVLGERLDAHRKRQQALHPGLTMTGMYNVLEKLRSGEALSDKEKAIHEQGLVSVLKEIHDDLDAAVFAAYGWPVTLTDEEILERLVALNAERAAEEQRGLIRWLRPEFQNPTQGQMTQTKIAVEEADDEEPMPETQGKKTKAAAKAVKKLSWPKQLTDQVQVIRLQLATNQQPVDATELAKAFSRADSSRIAEMLIALASLGMARHVSDGKYISA